MTQRYVATKMFQSDTERELQVQSSKCLYFVWINEEEVTLRGPGVREGSDVESLPKTNGKLDDEDFAIMLVLLFENGLWPEE